jgi:uncharacterized protein (DUF1697 family)
MPPRADTLAGYVALLRAVNVGGRGLVKKDALASAFARAGGANVRTFIASGNVLFDADPRAVDAIVADARRRLRAVLGAEPVVMVRSARELTALLRSGPFAGIDAPAIVKRYIMFLADPPVRRPRLPLSQPKEELDIVHVAGRDCWVVSRRKPSGMYGFPSLFVEAALGVQSTARSWSTVTKLAELLTDRGGGLSGPRRGGRSGPPAGEPAGSPQRTREPKAPASRSSRQSRTSSTARAAAASASGRAPAGSRRARGRAGGR